MATNLSGLKRDITNNQMTLTSKILQDHIAVRIGVNCDYLLSTVVNYYKD